MPPANSGRSGWQGASLVAITYVYFLIFAQFAFLKRLADLGVAGAHLQAVLAAMAIGGILFSLLTPRLSLWPSPNLRLRAGLVVSAAAAFLSLLQLSTVAAIAISFLIGAGLGVLAVTLVTHLRQWTGNRSPTSACGPRDRRGLSDLQHSTLLHSLDRCAGSDGRLVMPDRSGDHAAACARVARRGQRPICNPAFRFRACWLALRLWSGLIRRPSSSFRTPRL